VEHIDDYEMIDKDIERSIQYARECFEAEAVRNDESRNWTDRIRAEAELIYRKGDVQLAEGYETGGLLRNTE